MSWKKTIQSWFFRSRRSRGALEVVLRFFLRRLKELRDFHLPRLLSFAFGMGGVAALLISLKSGWFSVPYPDSSVSWIQAEPVLKESFLTRWFQLALAGWLFFIVFLNLMKIIERTGTVCLLTLQILGIIAYPCLLLYVSPIEVTRASWLSIEHESLSWRGGDVFTTQEKSFSGFGTDMLLIDIPRDIGAVPIPKSVPSLLQFGNFHMFAEYMGFSDGFAQFSRKGWHMALWGTILLVSMLIRRPDGIFMPALRGAFHTFVIGYILLILFGMTPVFLAAQYISKTHQRMLESRYDRALESLEIAQRILPAIGETTSFLMQKALLHSRLGIASPEAAYFRAVLLEQEDFQLQALFEYKKLLREQVNSHQIKREAIRALIRFAIYKVNSGKYLSSRKILEDALRLDFVHPQAIHAYQAACLKSRNLEPIGPLYLLLEKVYKNWHIRSKKTVLAISRTHWIHASYLKNDLKTVLEQRVRR